MGSNALRHILLALLLGTAAAAANAQAVFRSVMPDGRIIYGDKPAPGAKETRQIDTTQPNISAPGPAAAPNYDARQATLQAADNDVRAAQQQLDAAKAALAAGQEPTESERIGVARGGTRLNEDYDKRIKTLQDAVATAQRRVDDAQARRNNAR